MPSWLPVIISIGALIISCFSLAWNFYLEHKKRKAKLEIWQRNHFFIGGEDDRTEINLILRNQSNRPTAILDIYAKDTDGGVLKTVSAKDNVYLPVKIGAWDVEIVKFRMDKDTEDKIDHISVRDLDDKNIIVRRGNNERWQS